MIDLKEIQTVNPTHTIVKYQQPLPNHPIDKNKWYDRYNIYYELDNDTLKISNIKMIPSLITYLNQIKQNIKIIFSIRDTAIFNELCKELNKKGINKDCVILIDNSTKITKRRWLDFELIPNNVKVSNNKKDDYYPGENSFDWWLLWLNDKDFNCVINKLTPKVKNRTIYIRNIIDMFFKKYPTLAFASDYEKVNFVFEWLRKNTSYDSSATNSDGSLKNGANYSQDPVYTYINGRGVCCGRAQLMKILLNNRLMKVNCFLTDGNYHNLQHQWNEVYLSNGQVLYYDLSFNRKNIEKIESYSAYKNIMHQDALNWDFHITNRAKLKIKRNDYEQ